MSDIIINEEVFKKIATKMNQRFAVELVLALGDKYPELHVDECMFKHTKVLNMCAETMGFTNFHHIQKYFNKEAKQIDNEKNQKNFFKRIEENLLYSFLLQSMNEESWNDIWIKRSQILLDIGVKLFYWRMEKENFNPTSKELENCFDLDVLIEYTTKEDLDEQIKSAISAYLISLPGYMSNYKYPDKIPNTVYEQHGYLKIQFISILNLLHKLDFDLHILNKDYLKNKDESYLEYFEIFSEIRKEIDEGFKNIEILTINDLLNIYISVLSIKKRKSIIKILEYSIKNQDIIKKLIK